MVDDYRKIDDAPVNRSHSSSDDFDKYMLEHCDNDDRLGFVRKVYGILATQLTLTFGFVAVVKSSTTLDATFQTDPTYAGIAIAASVLALVTECALLCCRKVARKSPTNYIMLTIFTLCWVYMVGWICAMYSAEVVITASLMTMVLTVALTAFAMFTKADFTMCGPFMCWALLIICTISITMSIVCMFCWQFYEVWYPFACGLGVIIYGIFLICDTQMIIGGRRYQLSIDDYIVGALILYLDIIMIFLELLKLFGRK